MPPITTLSFDLTGTLLKPFPSIGNMCVEALKKQNLKEIPSAEIFDSRRERARRIAQANGLFPTCEQRSREYWRAMLWEIFAGCCSNKQFEIANNEIYQWLASPEHWQLMPGVVEALHALRFLGIRMVVLSNGDSRWEKALHDKALLPFFEHIFISAKTGFAKPDINAFDNLCQSLKIQRGELVHIGDTLSEDIVPATQFGAHAIWVTAQANALPPPQVKLFNSLLETPTYLRELLTKDSQKNLLSRSARNMIANLRELPEEPEILRDYDGMGGKSALAKRIEKRSSEALDLGDTRIQNAADLFPKILIQKGIYKHSLQDRIQENWNEIIPEKFKNRSQAIALEQNLSTLTIQCENTLIRNELEFQKRTILKKIQNLKGGSKIKKIIFTL